MRRIVCLLIALVMCLSIAAPVFAADNGFVPSITYKGEPEIVEKEDETGTPIVEEDKPVVGEVVKQDTPQGSKPEQSGQPSAEEAMQGEKLSNVMQDCLLIPPVSKVDTQEALPDEAAEELKTVYKELSQGDMKLPYEKVEDVKADEMVILELLDLPWLCGTETSNHDHPTEVEPEGVVFDVTFKLGVSADAKVVVMTYKDGEWNPIAGVTNNGDGTVTCVFEHLCPVAISVEQAEKDAIDNAQTGDDANIGVWVGVMAVALIGLLVLVIVYRRQTLKKG